MKKFSSKTKGSFRHNSSKRNISPIILSIAGALFVLFVLGDLLGRAATIVTAPVYGIQHWFSESSATIPMYFRERGILIDSMHGLEKKLSFFEGREVTFQKVVEENKELRLLLGSGEDVRIMAGIIARPPQVPYDSLFIDRGSEDGVVEGATVYHYEDRAVGFVSKTFQHSALVTPFSSPGVEVSAYVIGPDIYTKLYGEGGGVMRVSVPQGIDVTEGDIVVLPYLSAGIVGTISTVESVPTQPEQHGFVVGVVPIQSLQYVAVSTHVPDKVPFEEAYWNVEAVKKEMLIVDVPEEFSIEGETATGTSEELIDEEIYELEE